MSAQSPASTFPPPDTTDSGSDAALKERAQDAKDEGMKVASTAKDEAMTVVAESRRQAADLLREGAGQVQEQAAAQKTKAAEGLRALGDELQTMAGGTQAGPAADLAHQASQKITGFADWLDQNDPGTLVEEMRDLARRKPGTFLIGALAAGVLAGRVTRGVQGASSNGTPKSAAPSTPSMRTPAAPTSPMTPSSTPSTPMKHSEAPVVAGGADAGLLR